MVELDEFVAFESVEYKKGGPGETTVEFIFLSLSTLEAVLWEGSNDAMKGWAWGVVTEIWVHPRAAKTHNTTVIILSNIAYISIVTLFDTAIKIK